jgi:hypothetical protein
MKIAFLYILLGITTCNMPRTPDILKMNCSNQSTQNCLTQSLDGKVQIVFKDALSSLVKNKQQVGIFCDILNNTGDTFIFQIRKFKLLSNQINFQSIPFGQLNSDKLKMELYDSVLKIAPKANFENYVLTYKSDKKVSNKEYNNILNTDTFKLKYQDNPILFLTKAPKAN